jgi:hypothetical protein
VKSRTFKKGSAFVDYWEADTFDWLAVIILEGGEAPKRRLFLIPRAVADAKARRDRLSSSPF